MFAFAAIAAALGLPLLIIAAWVFVVVSPGYERFPGDPAFPELLLTFLWPLAAAAVVLAVIATVLARRVTSPRVSFWARSGGLATAALVIASLGYLALPILRRQSGEWPRLRAKLQDGEAQVNQLLGADGRELTRAEYEYARDWFSRNPISFQFTDPPQTVYLTMMRGVPPYVGVSFGNGNNAAFDLATMFCISSD